ncbi:MAG: DNA replication and repair protein RecF, partial [Candidatus Eremiobacteraeota bacterium]|nr:DNA replication and repair protein RecF [Candidatus Eremiobacteraeota bacterium]
DLHLVTGSPALRRAMLNLTLSQQQPLYYRNLAHYKKTLSQKMALLRGGASPDRHLLSIYNAELVRCGTALMLARSDYVSSVNATARSVHEKWVRAREIFEVQYAPSVPIEVPVFEELAGVFAERLEKCASLELARAAPLIGPHRDDLRLLLDGQSLAAFGSQGQQRTAVLALKVAEYTVLQRRSEETPLLLLDDVLSELDSERAREFLESIGSFEQAFMTATQPPAAMQPSACYTVNAATLTRVA